MAEEWAPRYYAWIALRLFFDQHLSEGDCRVVMAKIKESVWDFLEPPPPPRMAFDAMPDIPLVQLMQITTDAANDKLSTAEAAEYSALCRQIWKRLHPEEPLPPSVLHVGRGRHEIDDTAAVKLGMKLLARKKARNASDAAAMVYDELSPKERRDKFADRIRQKIGKRI